MSDSLGPHRLYLARYLCPWNSLCKNTGVGCHSLLQGIFPKKDQIQVSHTAHCRLVLYHLGHQGSPRILQWIAYSFSKGSSSLPRNWTWVSCITDRFFASWATREAHIYRLVVVQLLSHIQIFVTAWPATRQAPLSFTISQSLLNSCPLSWWWHPTILSSIIPFCLQSFEASVSFLVNRLCASSGQCTVASASVLLMNIQEWFPLRLIDLITVQSKAGSTFFSNTTVQKHQFVGAQPSLWSNSHIHT